MSQSEDEDEPFEKLETAKDHNDRADRLRAEAQRDIEAAVRDSLPFDADVSTTRVQNDNQFRVQVRPVDLQNTSVQLGEDDEAYLYTSEPLELVVTRDALAKKYGRGEGLLALIEDLQSEFDNGIPHDLLKGQALSMGMDESKFTHRLSELKKRGDIYEPQNRRYRTI